MARPTNPNINIPEAFAVSGTKTDFTSEKIQQGFDPINPDILSGDNLNKFIDDTYKGLNFTIDGVEDLYSVSEDINSALVLKADKSSVNTALTEKANRNLSNLTTAGEAHFSNPDLTNLTNSGLDKLNQSKALETGSVSSDSAVLQWVKDMADSTFDISKFTIVGSPAVTSDGIASGFSNSDYLTLSSPYNTFSLYGEYLWNGINPSSPAFVFQILTSNNYEQISIYQRADGKIEIATRVSDTSYYDFGSFTISANTPVSIIVTKTAEELTIQAYQNNVSIFNKTVTTHLPTFDETTVINIGKSNVINGTVDLKHFSITTGGVEVFSGNKTGVDTVKSDDYTVVGSPVISGDGIYNCVDQSSGNYLTHYIGDITGFTSLKISCTFTQVQNQTGSSGASGSFYNLRNKELPTGTSAPIITAANKKIINLYGGITGGEQFYDLVLGNTYTLVDELTPTTHAWSIYDSEGNLLRTKTFNASYTSEDFYKNLTVSLGNSVNGGNNYNSGTIDLNAFKVYIDGELVYQPCLKIPYTKSKTGSKIVNSAYRGRVGDMYAQYGYAPYYTLSDTDFTLPMGEIYGMIGRLDQISQNEIGLPVPTLSNKLNENEIWLEGAEVSKRTYAKLYAIYGDTYGEPDNSENFILPDFTDRVMWGVDSSGEFGYISAGLPNITGSLGNLPRSWQDWLETTSGAFYSEDAGINVSHTGSESCGRSNVFIDASRSSSIYGNSATVQPPAVKVRFKARYV